MKNKLKMIEFNNYISSKFYKNTKDKLSNKQINLLRSKLEPMEIIRVKVEVLNSLWDYVK